MLDLLVDDKPDLRRLKSPDVQAALRARLPWKERRALYNCFAVTVAAQPPWDLLHPFDDLTGPEMKPAVEAASGAKTNGLQTLNRDERFLLLRAGALDFVRERLPVMK